MTAMRIGLYGGSFNPVHYGHVALARKALEDLALDRLVVLPAHVSPFKTEAKDAYPYPFPPRLDLLRAVFSFDGRIVVDDREVKRGGVSWTVETVREMAAENAGAELFFLIGEDSLEGLPRWKEIDEIKRLVTFKAYPRTKESSTEIRALFAKARVRRNPDEALAERVIQGVLRKGGFCPCRLEKRPEFFCPCDEFKAQMADPAFHGPCHCRLYLKP